MISDARRGHVSPGIYTEEKDVQYSVKSLGITSLGLVGETLYGPAFQNVEISNWGEFVDYFGGTSPEKFKNGNLKYELPYVAKSYLEESNRLNVVRVLGLSGYEAGPAWVLPNNKKAPVLVLRSRMSYKTATDGCNESLSEKPNPVVVNIEKTDYKNMTFTSNCEGIISASTTTAPGKLGIKVTFADSKTETYYVSLNKGDNDYIYNVISSTPKENMPIYIEAFYESNLNKLTYDNLADAFEAKGGSTPLYFEVTGKESDEGESAMYTVTIKKIDNHKGEFIALKTDIFLNGPDDSELVENKKLTDGTYYTKDGMLEDIEIGSVLCYYDYDESNEDNHKFGDFKEGYRYAQTPWIVSEASFSSATTASVKKLFRFATISDGDAANTQVKVSIQNIDVENGVFDVVVRDFFDNDVNPIILETFKKCNLVDGDSNYIAYKIGSTDGGFVAKSKYILVEMGEGGEFSKSIPSGFLGYPVPDYIKEGEFILSYNTEYKPEIKARRQYFGLSDNIDSDILKYKGKNFYGESPDYTTNGFHMDAGLYSGVTVWVDNIEGYKFTSVSPKTNGYTNIPRLQGNLEGSLYENINTRKFTVCFYGGFDGWDIFRNERTNTEKFKSTKYKASSGVSFYEKYQTSNDNYLDLPTTAITSDYYAYLAGCRIFANPQDIDINLFATPGINWEDHALLTQEIIDIIEDAEDGRGGDALYVMASPNLTDTEEAISAFEDAGVNSSYACTYFPWVMHYDASNKRYFNIPVTKDVLKNMAAVDNNSYPWFAPAGTERGKVNCVKAVFKTRLGDEDALYEAGINPVKSFAQDGVIIWGNKTTYSVDSPINRINVRRMMIRVKKLIMDSAKHLIFEQYDETLEKQFRGIVEPILANVKANRGIIDYRVITESTPETRDQHILPAKILIKPTQSLEYISISFTVYPESVQFEE